ncbi:MAG: gliding motility-associated C-terminal domain-containing protein [Flavobacterium sp.]
MRLKRYYYPIIAVLSFIFNASAQTVSLYNQFNGRYDFTFIGNTLNLGPNGANDACLLLPSSDAVLNLGPNDSIQSAYLYWAGSGTGDFNVKLNGIDITSQRNFSAIQNSNGNPFFSAFADVTALLQTTGNGNYSFSELDVTPAFDPFHYCDNGTNFAGWAIVIVYGNPALPLNQINIYDGLEALSTPVVGIPAVLTINLGNLNVLDNSGAKLGFVAWEGDANIANQESLLINGNPLSNALNPVNNAFNGTNSITGSSDLYNMDLDIYDIQNSISIGNTSATITMTTAQDFVLINTIVSKLNSQLPDATVTINSIEQQCDSRAVTVNYSVHNFNSTDPLPAGTPIAIYIDGVFTAAGTTTAPIAIGGSANFSQTITVPDSVPLDFDITVAADDRGDGSGIVAELNETNNAATATVSLWVSPTFNLPENLIACNEGFGRGTFDFSSYAESVKTNPEDTASFFESAEDASNHTNPILDPQSYVAIATPKQIFIRISNDHCFAITSFLLTTKNCPPKVYNYVSVNNDNVNDTFTIEGLRDIFLDFKLEVYNRWGRLLWTGDNNSADWDGYVRDGFNIRNASDGTYFYLLFLNDADYPEPLKGFLYLNH